VVEVDADAVRGQCVEVVREVCGPRVRFVHRRQPGVVLSGQHEDAVRRLHLRGVRERVARLAGAGEPHFDGVPGLRPGDDALHDVVVEVADPAALAAVPLAGRRRLHGLRDAVPRDLVVQRHCVRGAVTVQIALGEHPHRLRVAVGDGEREVDRGVVRLLRVGAVRGLPVLAHVEIEGLDRVAQVRDRLPRVRRRLREVEGERDVLLELALHEGLVVGEHEPAAVAALVQLDRPGQRSGLRVRVVVGGAVRDVQIGADARVVAADRRSRVDPRVRHEQRVVRRRRLHLPPERIEDQRTVRVVRDEELELEPVDQRLAGPCLGLGGRAGSAVVVGGELHRRAFVVVAPVDVVVAVQVDAVVPRELPVPVVVMEVLPPQALVVERVLVAVRVRDHHEPQLPRVDEVRDVGVLAVVVHEVVEQAAVHLGGDPLARVDRGHVEDVRPCSVGERLRVLRDLERDDLAPLQRLPDHLELRDLRVALGDRVQLVANAAARVVRAIHPEPARRLLGGALRLRAPLPVAPRLQVHALRAQLRDLGLRQHEVDLHPARGVPRVGDVVALPDDPAEHLGTDDARVQIDRRRARVACARTRRACREREHEQQQEHGENRSRHGNSPPRDSGALTTTPRGVRAR
jgi:hypothetical protein